MTPPDLLPESFRATAPPPKVPLRTGEIHLWLHSLWISESGLAAHLAILSDGERKRADAFKFPRDRRRYIVARAQLRRILGSYTGAPSPELDLRVADNGKPFLYATEGAPHFNVSHSEDQVLFAFSPDGPVGVDLEDLSHESRLQEISGHFCSTKERSCIDDLPQSQRNRALLRIWTAKEAFLKATGHGLYVDPTRLTASDGILAGLSEPTSMEWVEFPQIAQEYLLLPLPECEMRVSASACVAVARSSVLPDLRWITSSPAAGE